MMIDDEWCILSYHMLFRSISPVSPVCVFPLLTVKTHDLFMIGDRFFFFGFVFRVLLLLLLFVIVVSCLLFDRRGQGYVCVCRCVGV